VTPYTSIPQLLRVDLRVSDITLDSIVFDRQEIYGLDTFDFYKHYYNGELTLSNSTSNTVHHTNVYSQWLSTIRIAVESHRNYKLEEPLLPGEGLQIPIRYTSFLEFDTDQLSFYCYGYNDRRMETPVEAVANILASNTDYIPIDFSVYPNPVGDQLTVQLSEESDIDYAILYDACYE